MNTTNYKKSMVGIELVRILAAEGDKIFSIHRARELAPRAGIKDSYLCESLYHLRRNNWIAPIRRGLYSLSSTLPGVMPIHEYEIAMNLVSPAAISHWTALNHHGLSDQIPRVVFVLTTSQSSVPRMRARKSEDNLYFPGDYIAGDITYRFIQVKPERFFGTEDVWVFNSRALITDPERTLLDGLCHPQYCGDLSEVLHGFNVIGDNLNVERIVEYAIRLGTATAKRLGWVLEHFGFDSHIVDRLVKLPIKGYRKLDPSSPHKGPYNKRWMIQENLPGAFIT